MTVHASVWLGLKGKLVWPPYLVNLPNSTGGGGAGRGGSSSLDYLALTVQSTSPLQGSEVIRKGSAYVVCSAVQVRSIKRHISVSHCSRPG